MSKIYQLGTFGGLKLLIRPSALIGLLLLWTGLTSFTWRLMDFPPDQALAAGLGSTVLHFISELVHNMGHSVAARQVKRPMEGVLFWGLLATSLYPKDEKKVTPRLHIRRALGGPIASFILTILTGLQLAVVSPVAAQLPPAIPFIAMFLFWDNLLIFTLGSILPLGFTDGSTILQNWKK